MITCIIIDDERKAREAFKKIIDRYYSDKINVVADSESVKEGVAAIHKFNPDIVFLDIEMPGENGFKLFEYFEKLDFDVIFTTAFNKYAIEAIKHSALDYILKPINIVDLAATIKKFEHHSKLKTQQERIEILLSNINMGNAIKSKVALPTLSGYEMKKINEIIYCKGDQNYTKIHLVNDEQIIVSKTLKIIEDLLPSSVFFRIHKTYLVNLNYVEKYIRNDGHKVILDNGTQLNVANRRIEEFTAALTNNSFNETNQ